MGGGGRLKNEVYWYSLGDSDKNYKIHISLFHFQCILMAFCESEQDYPSFLLNF